ncbi:hypothetical protein [Allocoleopsis franciscana]|uniref:Uncharacterized protein n=1 Tax=Allocoleopsis franciscana PCC 7113 TaxID=1173027 RepID=K9WM74_9CYAN|nr:hypothetical protein [Allocoleopsis franciscana]AFZ21510.1 hypothetical protein Mic7113_5906 [Allocoleopsis franciscana PCC 7113]
MGCGQKPLVANENENQTEEGWVSIAHPSLAATLVYGLADGCNGLREALEEEFSHFQFILDRPHLKQHLYAMAEAMELTGKIRLIWLRRN